MGIKDAVKSIVPDSVLSWRKGLMTERTIARHKAMSRPEVEAELCRMYRDAIGAELDLAAPRRFTEKIQWRKLNGVTPLMSELSDKYAARAWVSDRIGSEHLVPFLGVWDRAEDVPFGELPGSFVLKTNNACATNIIVRDKEGLDRRSAVRRLRRWLGIEFGWESFEYQYLPIKPRVIAEGYLDGPLPDYKFFCFGGEPAFVGVYADRGTDPRAAFLDMGWEMQEWTRGRYRAMTRPPERPASFGEMVELARTLSSGFSHVRVDFYEHRGRPLFGEMTFTTSSGLSPFLPDRYDFVLGDMWELLS